MAGIERGRKRNGEVDLGEEKVRDRVGEVMANEGRRRADRRVDMGGENMVEERVAEETCRRG